MTDVVLDPERWESVEAGDHALLERWFAAEGDHVRAGQVLAQALLVQQAVQVTAPHAGVLEEIVVPGGQTFSPGATLARVIEF